MEQPSLPSQKRRRLRRKSCSSCDGVAPELHVLACARFRLQLYVRLARLLRVQATAVHRRVTVRTAVPYIYVWKPASAGIHLQLYFTTTY